MRNSFKPTYTSAFYLPQFHSIPENDKWWGKGFTEWRAIQTGRPVFSGHLQPMLPTELGYYDLRLPETLGEQAALARSAGISAFCVYHYWFDGKRLLETPLNNLLERQEIDFPFYLCWANESWRRNWDGLSGEILIDQGYRDGFEYALVDSTLPYMRDRRYQRPDGKRPRFVIYRPTDIPDPIASVARMREAWQKAGIGEVELGAVIFHSKGKGEAPSDLFDFWIEMPPHGLVKRKDIIFDGPKGYLMGKLAVKQGFNGLIYDYSAIEDNATSKKYCAQLPLNTITGIMPSWDNSARRGQQAHIAAGANPQTFRAWLQKLTLKRLPQSYRGELFINAWNEWAENAILEPSEAFGSEYLEILKEFLF